MKTRSTSRPDAAEERRNAANSQSSVQMKQATAAAMPDARAASLAQLRNQEQAGNSTQAAQLKAHAELMAGGADVPLQRVEDDELLQGKFDVAQREVDEDEELLQGKFEPVQRMDEEELLQGKFEALQRKEVSTPLQGEPAQAAPGEVPVERQEKPNDTGLPDQLKSGIESLSGMSMDHVKVHYNSDKPAQLQAHAYAQGSEIHVAPGQEQHVPHEAWHVVQQAQGRVTANWQTKSGIEINEDGALESEADRMGSQAVQLHPESATQQAVTRNAWIAHAPIQRIFGAGPSGGHEERLLGTAESLEAASEKVATFISERARNNGTGVPDASSALGANHAGNLYVKSNFLNNGSLEAWGEMTVLGGGYIKRVRVTQNGNVKFDRVMGGRGGTPFHDALAADRDPGATAGTLPGDKSYPSVHGVEGGDAEALVINDRNERSADNLTKVMGEGARFLWISSGLADGTIGNTTTDLLRTSIDMPPTGKLEMDPTFKQLWGSWDSCFGRSYMQTVDAAVAILQPALRAGWVQAAPLAMPGPAPLASGATANGQVTSLLKQDGSVAMTPLASGASMVTNLGMTWTSNT